MQTNHAPTAFAPELIARYDVSGPRYTSYPTAPQFQRSFGDAQFRAAAIASNAALPPRPLSLYVHVPFCLSPCFYCGCNRVITSERSKAADYLGRLHREIDLVAPLFAESRRVVQLHFGGGTPNFLDAPQMRTLMDLLDRRFRFTHAGDREFGIELDPRFCDADYVRMLAAIGFNRISIGIQDFDPDVQRAVNRIQSVERTRAVIDAARECGVRSVSVDLIYGLPKQTPDGFARTLDAVVALGPDRVACYAYAHLPERFRAQRQIEAADLPNPAARLVLLGLAVRRLDAAGYRYVGMDHFARPGDDLVRAQDSGTLQRNFQGYSTHGGCDLIGLGASAISHVGATFSQNAPELPRYYAALDAGRLPIIRGLELSADDLVRADAIQQLMCHGVLDVAAFEAHHKLDMAAYFARTYERLAVLERDGLVSVSARRIEVTPRGCFLLRNIAMCFDAYLDAQAGTQAYSRAV